MEKWHAWQVNFCYDDIVSFLFDFLYIVMFLAYSFYIFTGNIWGVALFLDMMQHIVYVIRLYILVGFLK